MLSYWRCAVQFRGVRSVACAVRMGKAVRVGTVVYITWALLLALLLPWIF